MPADTNREALRIADELEAEYMAVARGEKKPGKIKLEPLVRAVQSLRALAQRPEPAGVEEVQILRANMREASIAMEALRVLSGSALHDGTRIPDAIGIYAFRERQRAQDAYNAARTGKEGA